MKKIPILALFLALFSMALSYQAFPANPEELTILVDGVPLDAKGVSIDQELYVPAWILENYGNTRIIWKPGASILEINTVEPEDAILKMEGAVSIRIGFYAEEEGFIIGKNTRVYILNLNPGSLDFGSGDSLHRRAHESTISRLQPIDEWVLKYLDLSPPERYYNAGLQKISKMDKETILGLNSIVEKYENLYQEFYHDLLSTLVFEKEREISESATISPELKDIKIMKLITDEEGKGKVTLQNGTHFVFCRMYHQGRLIIWNLPVTVTGNDISLELTNRNVTYKK